MQLPPGSWTGFRVHFLKLKLLTGCWVPPRKLSRVVYFQISDAELKARLEGRRNCNQCGAIWHVATKPTKRVDTCDACGGALLQRADDRPEAIDKRLQEFHKLTEPLRAYYQNKNLLRIIDASRTPDVIYQELVQLMQ